MKTWTYETLTSKTIEIISNCFDLKPEELTPESDFLEEFPADSLDFIEMMMAIEETFEISLDSRESAQLVKPIFARRPFRVRDFVEAIARCLNERDPANAIDWTRSLASHTQDYFSQRSGIWIRNDSSPLFKSISVESRVWFLRESDGMRCRLIPENDVMIGSIDSAFGSDELPVHSVWIDSFLIDREPVSTTAYCRFLNSIHGYRSIDLRHWFQLDTNDRRRDFEIIQETSRGWEPQSGTETWPMILVSWYGAHAYALWANGHDWNRYLDRDPDAPCFLPSEAQWEYAARGPQPQRFPWGDSEPIHDQLIAGHFRRAAGYELQSVPLAPVQSHHGVSPFGLVHMAGNVWQWCCDWYDPIFYDTPESRLPNPVNRSATGIRSERGGSWIGSVELCRSSYRRGRKPNWRGRCLGFRCISRVDALLDRTDSKGIFVTQRT